MINLFLELFEINRSWSTLEGRFQLKERLKVTRSLRFKKVKF